MDTGSGSSTGRPDGQGCRRLHGPFPGPTMSSAYACLLGPSVLRQLNASMLEAASTAPISSEPTHEMTHELPDHTRSAERR